MVGAIEELERASALCERIGFPNDEAVVATRLLEPIACFLDAETAVFRVFSVAAETPTLSTVVTIGIPDSVNDAYATRYFRLDPARRLLQGRRAQREEFLRYRNEFLWPNKLYHHVGFRVQGSLDRHTVLLDFHRAAKAQPFSRLEQARAKLVAVLLNAKLPPRLVGAASAAIPSHPPLAFGDLLSPRESEVAEAVALGSSNKEIAVTLGISVRTVENHLRSIFAKLGVVTRARLAARFYAARPRTVGRTAA